MRGGLSSDVLCAALATILGACGPANDGDPEGVTAGSEDGSGLGPGPSDDSIGAATGETISSVLPVLWIDVNGQSIPEEDKITGSLRVIEDHDGTLTNIAARPSSLEAPIGIEYRGQWSLQFPKKSYSIELRDEAGEDLAFPLLGMPAESDWVLRAGYYDHTLMRDALGFWLFREVWGRYASRYRFVEVYVDGDYEGVYLACEKVKRDPNRVDLPRVAPDAGSGDLTGGYLVHIESNSGGEGFETSSGRVWEYAYPSAEEVTPEQEAYLRDHFDRFEQAMNADHFADPTNGFTRWLDLEAAVDFALFQELARNTDGYTKSSYYQKLPDSAGGRLLPAPIWDNDLSFGNFANGTDDPAGWLYEFDWNDPVPWWERIWGDAGFQNAARCRWQELRVGPLTSAAINAKLDEFAAVLVEAQPRENDRWELIGREESRSAYVGETWTEDIDFLKRWVTQRIDWLDAGLADVCRP
jgi:hypothetical protein